MLSDHRSNERGAPIRALHRFGVAFGILCVILFLIGLAFQQAFYAWWLESVRGPEVQQALGVRIEGRRVTEVVPGGAFDRAGVRIGDRVVCLHHGDAEFWGALAAAADGHAITFRFASLEEAEHGCQRARSVTIGPSLPRDE
jgi:hypothetical protein